MQTKRQLKWCTRNVHPSFAVFRPGLGVNFHILLTQNWLWESSLSLLSLWCILFQIKLGLFRENLNLKKHLGPKNGWSSPSTFWHGLICQRSAYFKFIPSTHTHTHTHAHAHTHSHTIWGQRTDGPKSGHCRKFFSRTCRVSNLRPFDHKTGALPRSQP